MTFLATARVHYPARLQRAEFLGSRYAFAKEILDFYRHVAAFQQEFCKQLPNRWGKQPVAPAGGDLRSELRVPLLIESFGSFLSVVERYGPAPLAVHARQLRDQGAADWTEVLEEFWKTGLLESSEPPTDDDDIPDSQSFREFFARAFLQPYAEFIAASMLPAVLPMTVSRCPRCNGLPLLGVLRPEGDGGKRFLQCSFCSQEWEFRRIFCAHCGEDQEQKLAVYVAEEFPHIRVEICESCGYFLRTIDLTKDGNAVPVVDDLAAIPLGLWTHEHGYQRIQQNLLHT